MLNMSQTSKAVILLLLSFLHFKFINGICNVCQPENMAACHNETTYSICIVDNLPTKDLITCPENLICTDGKFICYPRGERAAACTSADQIDDEKTTTVTESFVSPTSPSGGGSYGQTDNISSSVSTDSSSNDLDDKTTDELITSSSATESSSSSTNQDTISSSTSSESSSSKDSEQSTPDETTVTTTTTRATTTTTEVTTKSPRNPETLCREVQASGDYINELDSTCKSYVKCMGTMAIKLSCPEGLWFDAEQGFCFNIKPTNCT